MGCFEWGWGGNSSKNKGLSEKRSSHFAGTWCIRMRVVRRARKVDCRHGVSGLRCQPEESGLDSVGSGTPPKSMWHDVTWHCSIHALMPMLLYSVAFASWKGEAGCPASGGRDWFCTTDLLRGQSTVGVIWVYLPLSPLGPPCTHTGSLAAECGLCVLDIRCHLSSLIFFQSEEKKSHPQIFI